MAHASINGQQISLVVVRDKERIARIAQLAGQPAIATADTFVAFVVDFNRTAEAAKLVGFYKTVETQAPAAERTKDWVTLGCFAVASSVENVFY